VAATHHKPHNPVIWIYEQHPAILVNRPPVGEPLDPLGVGEREFKFERFAIDFDLLAPMRWAKLPG